MSALYLFIVFGDYFGQPWTAFTDALAFPIAEQWGGLSKVRISKGFTPGKSFSIEQEKWQRHRLKPFHGLYFYPQQTLDGHSSSVPGHILVHLYKEFWEVNFCFLSSDSKLTDEFIENFLVDIWTRLETQGATVGLCGEEIVVPESSAMAIWKGKRNPAEIEFCHKAVMPKHIAEHFTFHDAFAVPNGTLARIRYYSLGQ